MNLLTAVVAAAMVLGAPAGGAQDQDGVQLVAKRTLRGDATLVDGFCRVPFGFLTAVPAAGGQREGAYRLDIAVRDSTGLLLHESGWSQAVGGAFLDLPNASTVEHFSFTVPDGRYTVVVAVTDSASGAMRQTSMEVESLPSDVQVSDLLLSGEIRRGEPDGAPGPGEIKKGRFYIASSTNPVLTPHQPALYYYLELYAGETLPVQLQATVVTADGQALTSSAPETMTVGVGGGVAARSFDLAGLPEGVYRLRLTVQYPDGPVVREAPFTMTGFETEAQIAEAVAAPQVDYFAESTEAQLDSLYGPLQYIMESDELGIYQDLSLDGKRNFMRTFWAKRDPTAGTPENEAMVAYYRLFYEANRRFRESGAGDVPGWRTDRGRIFLKLGEAEETLRRPVGGLTPPYEVWKYTRPRQLKYVFLDRTGLGNYQLIYTNDRFEVSRADWEQLLGAEAVQDVIRF